MEHASLTVGLAMLFGMVAQLLAQRLRVPAIVLMLMAGAALGPGGLGWIQPGAMGDALLPVVGLAVSVVLFEGALALDVRRLRERGPLVRRLVIWGGLITVLGGALAVRFLLGFSWRVSFLFGTLVMVTGPTVIRPLLRRVRVSRPVHDVLEAEGIFIDALGAVCVVAALRLATWEGGELLRVGSGALLTRLAIGLAVGLIAAMVLLVGLRRPRLVPEELAPPFLLSLVLATWTVSNALESESGAVAVITAGVVVGNARLESRRELLHFKERLTPLLLGMLFVLLAADVGLQDVARLGLPGLAVLLLLMLVVRPLAVWASTQGSALSHRERAFVAWVGPRGIVAAAMASLAGLELAAHGAWEAPHVRSMVFLVIAGTVIVQGLSAGRAADLFGVRLPPPTGYVLLGANGLARLVARALRAVGEPVVLVEEDDRAARGAEAEGFSVVYGDPLAERTLARTQPALRQAYVALTDDPQRNLLWAERAGRFAPHVRRIVAAERTGETVDPLKTVHEGGAQVLFGAPRKLSRWVERADRGALAVTFFRLAQGGLDVLPSPPRSEQLAPLLWWRSAGPQLVDDAWIPEPGDVAAFLHDTESEDDPLGWLRQHGWEQVTAPHPAREVRVRTNSESMAGPDSGGSQAPAPIG